MINTDIKDTLFAIDSTYINHDTNGEKGFGLGIKHCKDFVEMNHGIIFVESEVGAGSTFSFTLSGSNSQ